MIRVQYCYMEILKRTKALFPSQKVVIPTEYFYRREMKEFKFLEPESIQTVMKWT